MKKIIFFLILSFAFFACPTTEEKEDPFENVITSVLMEQYGDVVQQNCTFSFEYYHRLYRKPEFFRLQDKKVCEGDFEIRELELFTDDSVGVEFRISYRGDRNVLRDFLSAWNELTRRYETLDSLRIPDHRYGYAWTYLDPYDQDLFVRFPDEQGGVFSTHQWKQLESIKNWFQDLSDNRVVYSDSYSVVMVKDEDWEIVIEEGTDGYSEDIHR